MSTTTPAAASPAAAASSDAVALLDRMRSYFAGGTTRPIEWRRKQLLALERMLGEHEGDIAAALAADLGRGRVDAWLADVAPTVAESAFARTHLKRWMRARLTTVPAAVQPAWARYEYEPLGVVLVIGPWNYPVYLTLTPLVAALAAGNCVVIKPSEHAPATATLLAELLPRYLDPAAVAVVQGGPEQTQALLALGMDHVLFTGSPEVGALVMAAAAPTLTPVTLELGGKSPVIVAADADIEVTGRRIAWAKLMNSGQTCIAPDYVLVDRSVRDELVSAISRAAGQLRADQPALRLVSSRHAARLAALLEGHGGTVAYGGRIDVDAGEAELTVVVEPAVDSPLMREEIFGPLLPVLGVDGPEDAVRFVAERPKPLAVYVFSRARATQRRISSALSAGGVMVNHLMFHVLVPQLPFGGVGRSGMGAYHGRWGFETFSHRKAVLVKPVRPDLSLIYPPYTATKERILRRFF